MSELQNIIIIFCDDLGYGDIGSYGSRLNKTPRLDKMADEGIMFTDFYVSAPVCSPSRSSLMTGCYSQRIGLADGPKHCVLMPGDPIGISSEELTLAELLKNKGYATGCIGKWHLGDQPEFLPTRHGFNSFFGLPYSNDMHFDNKRWAFPPLPLMRDEEVIELDPDQSTLTQKYTEKAIDFITEHKNSPFFLYLAHMYVHVPLYASEEFMERSDNGVYGAAVECIDWSTGVILDALSSLGLDKNTLVIFTSDNGSNCLDGGTNFPLRGTKGTTWEGGMREPCIMRWPGKIPAGEVCTELSTTMDFLPTVADLVGEELPTNRIIDGKNIWPLIAGESDETPYEALFYFSGYNLEAVRSGKWKLHLKRELLFNLKEDIGESKNLYDEYPEIVSKLKTVADKCRGDLGDGDFPGKNRRAPGKVKNSLPLAFELRRLQLK